MSGRRALDLVDGPEQLSVKPCNRAGDQLGIVPDSLRMGPAVQDRRRQSAGSGDGRAGRSGRARVGRTPAEPRGLSPRDRLEWRVAVDAERPDAEEAPAPASVTAAVRSTTGRAPRLAPSLRCTRRHAQFVLDRVLVRLGGRPLASRESSGRWLPLAHCQPDDQDLPALAFWTRRGWFLIFVPLDQVVQADSGIDNWTLSRVFRERDHRGSSC